MPRIPRIPAPSGTPAFEVLPATTPFEPRFVSEPRPVNFNNDLAWQIHTRYGCQTCGACLDVVVHLRQGTREYALDLSNILRDRIDNGSGMYPKCSAHPKRDELSHINRDEYLFDDWERDSDGNRHEAPGPTDFDFI